LAQQALAIEPDNVKAFNLIALSDLRSGKARAAGVQLEEILKRLPHDTETSINLARVRLMSNDPGGAEELLRNAATRPVPDAKALFALADFYNITGDAPKAAQWYQRGLQAEPENFQALAALGRLHAGAGRNQEADAAFERLSRSPDRRFRYAYAMRLLGSGRKEAALVEFSRIFKENSDDREARTRLVAMWLDSSRLTEAEELLAKAIATDSSDVDALVQSARLHLLRGDADAAAADLNIVQQRRPESAEAHYLSAQVHRTGRGILSNRTWPNCRRRCGSTPVICRPGSNYAGFYCTKIPKER
jgi:tetratricopeptide (TPR) repeat protein